MDTLRPLTLHKFMQNKNYQVYFIVQPSDSVSHLALFEFLDFVTKQSRFVFLQYFQKNLNFEFILCLTFDVILILIQKSDD